MVADGKPSSFVLWWNPWELPGQAAGREPLPAPMQTPLIRLSGGKRQTKTEQKYKRITYFPVSPSPTLQRAVSFVFSKLCFLACSSPDTSRLPQQKYEIRKRICWEERLPSRFGGRIREGNERGEMHKIDYIHM